MKYVNALICLLEGILLLQIISLTMKRNRDYRDWKEIFFIELLFGIVLLFPMYDVSVFLEVLAEIIVLMLYQMIYSMNHWTESIVLSIGAVLVEKTVFMNPWNHILGIVVFTLLVGIFIHMKRRYRWQRVIQYWSEFSLLFLFILLIELMLRQVMTTEIYFAFVCMTGIVLVMYGRIQVEQDALHLKTSFEDQKKMNQYIEESEKQLRKIRHDLKYQIAPIQMHLEEGNLEVVKEELSQLSGLINSYNLKTYTGNQAVDYIISTKMKEAKEKDLSTKVIVNIIASQMNETDLSILLGNLLDNALEHAKNEIELEMVSIDQQIKIVITNDIQESVLKKNPDLHTTKTDVLNHGFGLLSVQEIVNKNHGVISFQEEDGKFVVRVVLPLVTQ